LQSITPLSADDFKEKTKQPVSKLEIYIDGTGWINLCDLNNKNYLISANYSSGQRELTYKPIAAEFSAVIDDTDGDFNPRNDGGAYKDYLKIGRKIRFSTGFRKNATDYLWQWFIGVISEISIDRSNKQIIIKGFDYTQYLIDTKLKSPDNYWGSSVTKSTVKDQADYELPAECNWPYIAYLDGNPIYEGDYWVYDQGTNKFWFLPSKIPDSDGTDNLVIYYYTDQVPENVVADLLVAASLYANRASALTAMDYTATGETIEKVRFNSGVSALSAIQKICERCDYEFYFKYDGTPVFKPIPSAGSSVFTFDENLISNFSYIENIDEVRNHIIIEGDEYTIYDELRRILDGSEIQYTLDEIPDGSEYGRVKLTGISAGLIIVAGLDAEVTDRMFTDPTAKSNIEAWRHASDTTLIDGGDIYTGSITANAIAAGTITTDKLSFTPFVIGTNDLDDVPDGTNYGRVLKADISAGHILLSATVGDLDDIADGSNYGKVALTGISAGKIVVAGLDSGVTARMFTDSTTKNNIEAWRHASDVTMIDGGDIYAHSVTIDKLTVGRSPNLLKSKYSDFQSFENGDEIGYAPSGTHVCDTSDFIIGDRCLKATIGAGLSHIYVSLGTSGTDYNIRLKPSTKYVLSCYAKASGTPWNFRLYIKQDDGTDKVPSLQSITTSWARYEFIVTTDANLTDSGIVVVHGNAGGETSVWVDAVQVEEASATTNPEASPYKPSGTVEIHGGQIEANTITTNQLKISDSGNLDEKLKIYQGTSVVELIDWKATNVNHQITNWSQWGTIETDTFLTQRIADTDKGGIWWCSLADGAVWASWAVYAFMNGNADTVKNGTTSAVIVEEPLKGDPTNHTYGHWNANANIWGIRTVPDGSSEKMVFFVDEDGDFFYDGSGSSYQTEDDVQMVKDLEDILTNRISKNKMKEKDVFKKHKIVHISEIEDEEYRKQAKGKRLDRYISGKKTNLLLMGAIRQLSEKIQVIEEKIEKQGKIE